MIIHFWQQFVSYRDFFSFSIRFEGIWSLFNFLQLTNFRLDLYPDSGYEYLESYIVYFVTHCI